jgi:hypothetical protein
MKTSFVIVLSFLCMAIQAQYTQQLRGMVTDQVLQKPISGASVTIGMQTVTTDAGGEFRFKNMPVGVYRLVISNSGYKSITLFNIAVNSGKETILTIPLEAWVHNEETVTVKASSRRNKPINDMSAVSARAFTVEETQKYAAAVNDPLRMATAFPGVLAGDDGNNNIIIRGNSPTGLLWRMEGMDIPSPNHFSQPGLSGGGISIINSQLLSNSDFVTAAFAPEYGNALSGVFDIKLRKGNNEKKEYNLQAGVLGLSASAEGPFAKNYKGSYLVNYRYSTLAILSKLGVLPNDGATNFQDLSYNIYLPAGKAGTLSLFGFAGKSDQAFIPKKDSLKWESSSDRYNEKFISNTSMNGLTHTIRIGEKLNIKTGIGLAHTKIAYDQDILENDYQYRKTYTDKFTTRKLNANTSISYQFNNRLNMRAGLMASFIQYNFYQLSAKNEGDPLRVVLNSMGNTSMQQAFAQWQYKPTDDVTVNGGVHYLRLHHNKTASAEPRFSVKWNINRRSSLAAGYGLHSQLQTLNVYFSELETGSGNKVMPNRNLDFTKSHHYVLSYAYRLTANMQLKTELYYQRLFNVPVSTGDSGVLSTLNIEYDYITDPLVNKGKGKNYGVEISLERYLRNNFYLTFSNSIYQSKYTAADGVERNTRFNGNYIGTFIAGKDFVSKRKSKTFGVNVKTIYAGGLRTTPIDFSASQLKGYTVFKEKESFSLQNPAYFRTDLRLSMKWNRKHITSTLSLDIQNVTNRLNVFNQSFDNEKNKIVTNYQTGLIPILNYKIDF